MLDYVKECRLLRLVGNLLYSTTVCANKCPECCANILGPLQEEEEEEEENVNLSSLSRLIKLLPENKVIILNIRDSQLWSKQ